MSANCIAQITGHEKNLKEPNWYALHLSSQEIFGRGLASYLIKKEATPSADDIRATFAAQNLLGVVASSIIMLAARPVGQWYGQDQLDILLTAAGLASYGYSLRGVPLALLERSFDYFKVSIIEILESILFYATAIPLAWMGDTVTGLALAIVLRSWGPTLLTFILKPLCPTFRFSRRRIVPIADFGLSVAASSLVNIAVYSIPAVFVGKLSGMKELGHAQMAFSLYSNLLFVTAAVVRLNLSAYARLIAHTTEFAATVNQHLQILSAVMVPLIVIFAGLAPIWTSLVLGEKWHALPILLLAQVPGYLLAAVCWGVLNPALLVSGKHHQVFLWLTAFFTLYSGLTRWLSPSWGAMGVAIAFSSTEIILHPWLFFIHGIKHLKYGCFFPRMLLGAVSAGIVWMCARLDLRVGFLSASLYLIVWCACNRKILTSAIRDINFSGWYRSTQNLVVPIDD